MTLVEALAALRAGPDHPEALAALRRELATLAARVTDDPRLRALAVEAVHDKLVDQALAGDLPVIDHPPTYLRQALKWKVLDQRRRDEARRKAAARPPPAPAPAPPPPVDPSVLEVLDRACAVAVRRRDPWQRAPLERAWEQVKRLHLEDVDLKEVVVEAERLDPLDAEAVRLAVQRAHTAHRRAREAVADALVRLGERGEVDADTLAEARQALGRLKRRQIREPSRVSPPCESDHEA